MGMTIGINSTEYFGMTSFIQAIENDPNTSIPDGRSAFFFIENILPKFGRREGTQFMVLNCEYWDEYNPYYQLLRAMELYFGIEDVWYDDWEYLDNGENAVEVLEELGIEPIGEINY